MKTVIDRQWINDLYNGILDKNILRADFHNEIEKHLKPSKSVEELIETYQNRLDYPVSNDPNEKNNIQGFIKDLKELKEEATEEKIVEIKGKGCGLGRCKCGEDIEEYFNYCGNCGAKIKRIE